MQTFIEDTEPGLASGLARFPRRPGGGTDTRGLREVSRDLGPASLPSIEDIAPKLRTAVSARSNFLKCWPCRPTVPIAATIDTWPNGSSEGWYSGQTSANCAGSDDSPSRLDQI